MKSFFFTLFHLGLSNSAVVLLYRLALRVRIIERLLPAGESYRTPLFHRPHNPTNLLPEFGMKATILQEAKELFHGRIRFFSNQLFAVGSPPDWFLNPLKGTRFSDPDRHWSRLPDFDSKVGDIKCIWESSRFDWALILARAYRLTSAERYLTLLNEWASDWIEQNPLNVGPNWKCGQETAIRMLQVLLTAYLLEQHRTPTPGLKRFVTEHCARIVPTIRYAIAQDNNHGTSEAAALCIGGAWLISCFQGDRGIEKQALTWHRLGKRWLENLVRRLIALDGSFSQYSLNYHRIVVDTLNIVEFWRRELHLPELSEMFYKRAGAAVEWLYQMVDPQTGDGPNLGANDGAHLFALSSTDYRDYRPSVQLGAALFLGGKVYPEGPWDEPFAWLGVEQCRATFRCRPPCISDVGEKDEIGISSYSTTHPVTRFARQPGCSGSPGSAGVSPALPGRGGGNTLLTLARKSCVMKNGGYVLMNFEMRENEASWGLIRFPNFRFRPGHADALHLDLWHNGVNILRDSGSYSYNTDEPWQRYFPGTAAHNTVEFDGRNQMPRLSRFLFGEWLKMEEIGALIDKNGMLSWTGSYIDYKNCRHKRTVSSNGVLWKIVDEIEGFATKAVLRWRLAPESWRTEHFSCLGELAEITVDSSVSITRFELGEGWESRYYLEKTKLPVLEIQVDTDRAVLVTEVLLKTRATNLRRDRS